MTIPAMAEEDGAAERRAVQPRAERRQREHRGHERALGFRPSSSRSSRLERHLEE
jgi:hypothetical protein